VLRPDTSNGSNILMRKFLKLLWLFSLCCTQLRAAGDSTFDIRTNTLYLPAPQPFGRFHHAAGLVQVYLPHEWLEQSIVGPMLEYAATFSLPAGFGMAGSVRTLLVANEVRLGPYWNLALSDKFYIGTGIQLGYGFGLLREFGFNNTINVWDHRTHLRVGYTQGNVAVTIQGRMDWLINTRLGLRRYSTESVTGAPFNGYSCGLFVEQRISRQKSVCFGFIANFNKFHILGWPALMIADRQFFIPEINIAFQF
jgi:hypothetical protein